MGQSLMTMDRIRHIFLLLLLGVLAVSHAEDNQARKRNRMVSIFNIVKFKNDPCEANDDKSGTCYTEDECADRKGTASVSCAEGYGVCCVFTVGCDAVKNENCTYFQSTGMPEGACNAKICPCASNICQLRLDFLTFNIAQPSLEAVAAVSKLLNGAVVSGAGKDVTNMGQCLTDTFTVTAPGGIAPPTICGQNDGQHMYIDASNDCNTLAFQLAGMGTRMWEIKVTQYSCEFSNLAPPGCLQYYYGVNAGQENQQMPLTEGTVESFNFAGKSTWPIKIKIFAFVGNSIDVGFAIRPTLEILMSQAKLRMKWVLPENRALAVDMDQTVWVPLDTTVLSSPEHPKILPWPNLSQEALNFVVVN